MEQALSLPEIRSLIGSFLSQHNRKTCALVSRAWAESITPWLWYSVTLDREIPPEKLAILHKHRTFVRLLAFSSPKELNDMCKWFENLQGLHFRFIPFGVLTQGSTVELIRRNQSSLRKMNVNLKGNTSLIFKAALECLSLKHLHCRFYYKIRERDMMESFVRTCARLTTLNLDYFELLEESHLMLGGQTFVNLERVTLSCFGGPYLDLLKASPNLKALTIYQVEHVSAKAFLETINTHCRRLCVLRCGSCGFDGDNEFEQLALTLPPMKCLQQMKDVNDNILMSSVFLRHFNTLQAIVLRAVGDFNIIQTILCSCPNLRSFFGEYIDARVIESGSPWVCKRLKYLQLEIGVPFGDRHLHTVVCGQLSQLKELRALNLSMDWWGPPSRSHRISLSLRMGEGLELLGSLKKLEHFGVGHLHEEWQDEDIKWMAQEWPDLECIYGDYQWEDEIYITMCEHLGISRVSSKFPHIDAIDFIDL